MKRKQALARSIAIAVRERVKRDPEFRIALAKEMVAESRKVKRSRKRRNAT
jgi:hypothetical protein